MISGPLGDCIIYRALSVIRLFSSRAHTHTQTHILILTPFYILSRAKKLPPFFENKENYMCST